MFFVGDEDTSGHTFIAPTRSDATSAKITSTSHSRVDPKSRLQFCSARMLTPIERTAHVGMAHRSAWDMA